MRRTWQGVVLGIGLAGCGAEDRDVTEDSAPELTQQASATLSREQLMDPQTCAGCHPRHYREWSMSMHAYAAKDPVFIAMNERGQRETNGELGDFCVGCHAPMAVREGLTKDGLNLDELPDKLKGVTCYFCHNAVDVGPEHHNNPLKLANDTTMRGSIRDAVNPGVHGVAYSEFFDNTSMKSSTLCGSCHDIVTPKGVHIERTFEEYKNSFFSLENKGVPPGESCQGCHMRFTDEAGPVATLPGLPARKLHDHRMAAVDVALTDFPHREEYEKLTECELLNGAAINEIYTDGRGLFTITIENESGHRQPSGAAQDRRMWLEFIAYNANDEVIYQSGVIPDGEREEWPQGHPKHDPALWMFRDHFVDETGKEVHMFWEAADFKPYTLPATVDPIIPHTLQTTYRIPGRQQPARVEMRLKMRPVGIDVLEDLVQSGDLDPAIIEEMPTFTLYATDIEWTPADGNRVIQPQSKPWPEHCN